jgi:iron complex outermembrane receptor protein
VYTFSSGKTTISNNFDGAFSPRLGLVLQPSMAHSIFASYSNSFALNSGVDINNNALAPSLIDQYELGIKNELFSGMLSANITAYRILNNNLAQNSLINASTYSYVKELVGSVQSEGIEIDLSTKPVKGFSLTGGYSYNETKYVKSNTYIEGSLLRYNPNHTANIGLSFRRNGFQAALTSVYIGERFAGRSTRVAVVNDAYRLIELPAYLQADLSLAYQVKSFAFRTKIANLGDVLSFNVHDDNSVNPIAPRNFSLSLTFIF